MINAYAVFVLCKPTFSWQRSSNGRKTLFKSLMFDGCREHECIFIHRVEDSKETRSPDNVVLNPPTQPVMMKRIVMTWWWWRLYGDDDQGCINCGILVSGIRAHGEHGDVFLFSNLGALWFSENLIRYSLHVCLREVKNNLFSFKHSYL